MSSKPRDDKPQASKPRPYLKPTLVKGSMLSRITALDSKVSGPRRV